MIDLRKMRRLMDGLPAEYKQRRLEAWAAATPASPNMSGMPHGNAFYSKTEDGAIRLAELDEAYHEVITQLNTMRAELIPLIDALPESEEGTASVKAAMRLRYIMGYRPEDIAESLGFDVRHVFRLLNVGETIVNESNG